jgi:hypothetical protein
MIRWCFSLDVNAACVMRPQRSGLFQASRRQFYSAAMTIGDVLILFGDSGCEPLLRINRFARLKLCAVPKTVEHIRAVDGDGV